MKPTWKRILALIMTLSLCLGLVPATALAEEAALVGSDYAPTLTSVDYNPVSTRLTATLTTADTDSRFFEAYLLTKKTLGSDNSYSMGDFTIGGETYNTWGIQSMDLSDTDHVSVTKNGSTATVTLSQPLYFGQERKYDMYPKPGEEVFIAVQTEGAHESGDWGDGSELSDLWALTVPEAGPTGVVTATLESLTPGTMTTEFGSEYTGNIATLSVTMEREEGVGVYFLAPCNSDGAKLETGNMPAIFLEQQYDPEIQNHRWVGFWEGIDETNPRVYTGPNGETITVDGDTLTAEIKVCQFDTKPQYPHMGVAEGESIVIWAEKLSGDQMISTESVMLEIPCTSASVGKTFTAGGDLTTPTITTASLRDAEEGSPYSTTLKGRASNDGALTWTVSDGSLPKGLTLSEAGVLSGTPEKAGTSTFTVSLSEEGVKEPAAKKFTLKVRGLQPKINTTSLPDGSVGKPYSIPLKGQAVKGGTLSWSVSEGSLPKGLALKNGEITGTPTEAGRSTFTVSLTEKGVTEAATQRLSITVKDAQKPVIQTTSLPDATAGKPYYAVLSGTGYNEGTLSWSLSEGALPDGLTLASDTGAISGTPGTASLMAAVAPEGPGGGGQGKRTYTFTVRLTETKGEVKLYAEKELSLTVLEPNSYTVSFSLNGGSTDNEALYQPVTRKDGQSITLPAAPTRQGYDFTGWRYYSTDYQPGAAVPVTGNMTFYAQWKEKPAVTLTYDGQVVGSVALRGYYDGENYATVWSGYYSAPATPQISVTAYYTSRYTFQSLSLWAYVDGDYTKLAEYQGDVESVTSAALTPTGTYPVVTAITVPGLTKDVDYTAGSIYRRNENGYGYYQYLPFMSRAGTEYRVSLNGISNSPNYNKYNWTDYPAAVSDSGTLTVTPETVTTDLTVTGHVYFGDDTTRPAANAQVQISQRAYGQQRIATAVTGADGAYSIQCFSGANAYWTVTYGGSQVAYIYTTPDGSAQDFHLSHLTALVTAASLDTGELSPEAAKKVRDRIGPASVYLLRSSDQKVLAGNSVWPGSYSDFYISDFDSMKIDVDWKVEANRYYAAGSGKAVADFTSGKGVVIETSVKPNAGILVDLSADFSSSYALAWFDADGKYVGTSWDNYLSSWNTTVLTPCPAGTKCGTFTVALMNNLNAYSLSTLDAIAGDWILKQWTVTLAENEIKELEAFRVEAPAGENAMYVTLPGSSMTADRESFSNTDELVRFTGTISLDAGLTNGKLTRLEISPRNNTDNISYSNSAPVQSLVIGGRVLQVSEFKMASSGYYYIDLAQPVDLPCDYTLYCKPGSPDWDMQVKMSGSVSYNGGSAFNQPIGEASVGKPGSFISTLSSYVCNDKVAVKGVARPNEEVNIYDNSLLIGSARANGHGDWSAKVPLKFTDPTYFTTHILTAETASGRTSEKLYVFHDAAGPEMTRFRMAWNGREIDVGDAYTYAGGMHDLTFKAAFLHPDKLETMTAWDSGQNAMVNAKVVFKYYLTNGQIGFLTAETCDGNGVYTSTTMPRTLYSSVTQVEALYQPVLNGRLQEEKENGSVFAMTETEQETNLAYLDEVVDGLNEAFAGKTGADDFALVFDADGKAALTGKDPTLPGETSFVEGYQEIAGAMAEDGGQMRKYAISYDDKQSVLEWVCQTGADWAASKPMENTPDAYYASEYTAYYAGKQDYKTEMKQIAGAAVFHDKTVSEDGKQEEEICFLTDGDVTGAGQLTGGTFLLSVTGFADDEHGIWMVTASLSLTPNFESFGKLVPNTPVVLLGADPQLMGTSDGKPKFNPNAQKVSMMLEMLRFLSDGAGENSFQQGTANGIGSILSDLQNTPGIKQLMESLNSLEALRELGGTDMLVDSLGYGSAAYALFNQLISTYDALFGETEAQSMLAQMLSWMNSPCWQKIMEEYASNLDTQTYLDAPPELAQLMAMGADPQLLNQYLNSNMTHYVDINTGEANPEVTNYKKTVNELNQMADEARLSAQAYQLTYLAAYMNNSVGNGAAVYGVLSADTLAAVGLKALSWKVALPLGIAVYVAGKAAGNSLASQTEQIRDLYNRFGQLFVELLDAYSGRLNDDDCSEMLETLTGQPPKPNEVSNDPSGVVFEAVIENPVPGAEVTLYYAVDSSGNLVTEADKAIADHIVQADSVRDLVPGESTQVTDGNGRYSWGVPEGLWYVTAGHAGYEAGNSDRDTAAKISAAGHSLLPVLPVQLNVNIPLVDRTAPYVTDVRYTGEGVYVTFSKYMDETACLDEASYTLLVNGTGTSFLAEPVEQGHVPDNLPEAGRTYTRTVLLAADGIQAGDEITLTVDSGVLSYAGTEMKEDFTSTGTVAAREQAAAPAATVDGKPAPMFVRRGTGVELSVPAPEGATIFYKLDGGETKVYTDPIVVNNDLTIETWATAPGYAESEHVTGIFLCSVNEHTVAGTVETPDGGSAEGMTATLQGTSGEPRTATVTGSGFTFGVVPEGSYTLTVTGSDAYRDVSRKVEVTGSSAVLALTLETKTVKPAVKITSVSGSTFRYETANVPDGATLIAARYDNGQMTDSQTVTKPKADDFITMKGTGTAFKLFLVDRQSRPLCQAEGWSK